MTTTPRHPLVEEYLAELRRSTSHLPRHEREELISELRAHVDAGAEQAESEADIRNMLDALGTPEEVAAASASAPAATGPTGRLALTFGILALVLLPIFAVPPGIVAVVLGVRARRFLLLNGKRTSIATAAVVTGASAILITVLLFTFAVALRSGSSPEPISGQSSGVPAPTTSGAGG